MSIVYGAPSGLTANVHRVLTHDHAATHNQANLGGRSTSARVNASALVADGKDVLKELHA